VPFEAIKGFFDPSVQFGLQFEEVAETEGEPAAEAANPASKKKPPSAPVPIAAAPAAPPAEAVETAETPESPDDKPTGGAEVVRLDRFRKK
jgi:hypothetical protein